MSVMSCQIAGHSSVCSTVCRADIKEISKLRVTVPLWGESTGNHRIPFTKAQWRRKRIPAMTSCPWGYYAGTEPILQMPPMPVKQPWWIWVNISTVKKHWITYHKLMTHGRKCVIDTVLLMRLIRTKHSTTQQIIWAYFDGMYCMSIIGFNLMALGRCGNNHKLVIPNPYQRHGTAGIKDLYMLNISGEFALWWMPQDFTDDESTSIQVISWCPQSTSHYLNQCECWPSFAKPYGVTRPQWVKIN